MTHTYKALLLQLILLTITLTGCSSLPISKPAEIGDQTAKQRLNQLKQLQQWNVKGKIAFFDGNNRNSTSLTWQVNQKTKEQKLYLSSYLGINVLQLESTNNNHVIQVDGKTYQGHNLEALIHSLTGLTLPTKALTLWLKSMPYRESDKIIYQKDGVLPQNITSYYNNELWTIIYGNYQQVDNYTLATKFSIRKDDLLIKIAINRWSIN